MDQSQNSILNSATGFENGQRGDELVGLSVSDLVALLGYWKSKTGFDAKEWIKAIESVLSNPRRILHAYRDVCNRNEEKSEHLAGSPTGVSLQNFIIEYLKYVKSNFSAKTYENAERAMSKFGERFGGKELSQFTAEDLENFKAQRKDTKVSNTTINIDVRTIKAAFRVAVAWKRIPDDPFALVKQLKVDKKTKRVLTHKEFSDILSAIKEKWLHDIIAFNVLTGLRLGEIMNLQWADYNPERQEITIQSSANYRVKGGNMRIVPIGADAAALLYGCSTESVWIFAGEKGKKYSNDYVSKTFKRYVRQLGLPEEIHYHRLRDTYCTWLAEANVPVHIIKELAGHSSIRVTENYITGSSEMMRDGVSKIRLPRVL